MSGKLKARFADAADRVARRLIRPFWIYAWNYIEQRTAPRDERITRLEEQLTLTLRAFGVQLAKLQGVTAAAASEVPGAETVRVSILVPTDTRVAAVENLLHCLQYQDGPEFEVIVIRGPTENGMAEMLARWEGMIKTAHNPERNISISRNLGAAMAAGNILAMIDDDALPEPDWLIRLIKPFENAEIGCTGGADFDHSGTVYAGPYMSMNRLGRGIIADINTGNLNFPYSYNFPFARGLNAAYRSEAFFAVGGFDEEYEYHHDEADLCCRIVDAGWHIKQLPDAIVHHKALPSHLRGDSRILRDWFPSLKAKLYFSLVNNKGHYPVSRAIADWEDFFTSNKAALREQVRRGDLQGFDFAKLDQDAKRGFALGLQRGLAGQRQMLTPDRLRPAAFLPFPRKTPPAGKHRFIFAALRDADTSLVSVPARRLAEAGHQINLVLSTTGDDHVDFETTLWVHRSQKTSMAMINIVQRLTIEFIYLPLDGDTGQIEHLMLFFGKSYTVTRHLIASHDQDQYLQDQSVNWTRLELSALAGS